MNNNDKKQTFNEFVKADKKPTVKELESKIKNLERLVNQTTEAPSFDSVIQQASSRLYRIETDIQKLRSAIQSSEIFNFEMYAELIRIYRDVELDHAVTTAKGIRKNYTMSREFQLFKNGEVCEEERVNKFFKDKTWVLNFIDAVLESIFWGYTLIQIKAITIQTNQDDITISTIQRQNVNPFHRTVLSTPYNVTSGHSIDSDEAKDWYILASNGADQFHQGLYSKVGIYQIGKKETEQSALDFLARYASPQVYVKTNMSNTKNVANVERYLANLNNSSYAILNIGDELNLLEASGKSSDVYQAYLDRMEQNIYKLIIGSPLSDEKSFVGTANVRENMANQISLTDMNYVENYFNNELIPRLVTLGFNFLKGVTFKFDNSNKAKPEEEFNNMLELLKTGLYTIDSKWIADKFSIPVRELNNMFPEEPKTEEGEDGVE